MRSVLQRKLKAKDKQIETLTKSLEDKKLAVNNKNNRFSTFEVNVTTLKNKLDKSQRELQQSLIRKEKLADLQSLLWRETDQALKLKNQALQKVQNEIATLKDEVRRHQNTQEEVVALRRELEHTNKDIEKRARLRALDAIKMLLAKNPKTNYSFLPSP